MPTAALKDLPFCSYYFVTDAANDAGANKGEKDRSSLWTVALRAGDFCLTPVLGVQVGVEVSLEPDPRDDLFRLSGRKAEIERHRRPSDALAEGDRPAYMGVALRTI